MQVRDVLDVGQFPGTYQQVPEATEHIGKYTNSDKFPLNRYATYSICKECRGSYAFSNSNPDGPGFLPYRTTRYCFPFQVHPDKQTPADVAEHAVIASVQAMSIRVMLGVTLLDCVPNWPGRIAPGNTEHMEFWGKMTRSEIDGAGGNPDDLILVINPVRSRQMFGADEAKNRNSLSVGNIPVVVENMVGPTKDKDEKGQFKRGYLWPSDLAVLSYTPKTPDTVGATLQLGFLDRMVVETKMTENKGRVVEDYRVSMDPVFGVLFQF